MRALQGEGDSHSVIIASESSQRTAVLPMKLIKKAVINNYLKAFYFVDSSVIIAFE